MQVSALDKFFKIKSGQSFTKGTTCEWKCHPELLKVFWKLLIYPSDPQYCIWFLYLVTVIFDQISVGSSLNPEFQETSKGLFPT